jgi:GH15 family glucan-1,4-alpha-glucosidase
VISLDLGVVGNGSVASRIDRNRRHVWHQVGLTATAAGVDGESREWLAWASDALARVGRRAEALEPFNNLLARRDHAGLLSEDIDPQTGELRGNFPRTFSQVGLVPSATRLSRSWEEGLWHAS